MITLNSIGWKNTVNVLYLGCTIFGGLGIFSYLTWIYRCIFSDVLDLA